MEKEIYLASLGLNFAIMIFRLGADAGSLINFVVGLVLLSFTPGRYHILISGRTEQPMRLKALSVLF